MNDKTRERGIHELYRQNPEQAEIALFGRRVDPVTRRGFLHRAGLAAMSAAIGASVHYWRNFPAGLIPAALADSPEPFRIPGKDPGLLVLNDRPINAETPAHLLDDEVTPADKLFVRNNGLPPAKVDPAAWTLTIDGEACQQSKTFTLADLKKRFEQHTLQLVIECGGNGRSEFYPPAGGNQWTTGAVGCPEWTGVRLADVLNDCGIAKSAVYIGYYGADTHPSGDPKKVVISRGVPMTKALEDETLIAWAMNGADMPAVNGHPLRLVCGGWPGSTSGKWLTRVAIRDRVHDGTKMGGKAYRVPCEAVAPGEKVADSAMCIIEAMPVKSLITFPRSGIVHKSGQSLDVRGHAWAGDDSVARVDISIDFGQTWQRAALRKPKNRLAWQHFASTISFPAKGYYEIWARATDSKGRAQPMIVPGWNPKGYLNNACHRIAIRVA